jgi:hypothetical protein
MLVDVQMNMRHRLGFLLIVVVLGSLVASTASAQAAPGPATAEQTAGHAVGNHTYDHPDLVALGEPGALNELTTDQSILTPLLGGVAPQLFRPPYGSTSAQVKADATQLGMTQIIWTSDTNDWNGATTASIVSTALATPAGGFVLMHDGYPNTISALPKIAAGLANRGLCAGKMIYSAVPTLAWAGGIYFYATVAPWTSTAPVGPPPPGTGPTGMSALVDNFDSSVFNNVTWDGSTTGVVSASGGRGVIPCTSAYPSIGTVSTYDLTNAGAFAQFTPPPVGAGSREMFLQLSADANDQLQWARSGSTFAPHYSVAGVWSQGPSISYSSATAWWRIRNANGNVIWETSPDGFAWTAQWTVPSPFSVTNMTVNVICGYWGTETAANSFVDNFNLTPTVTPPPTTTTTMPTTTTTVPSTTTTSTTVPSTTTTSTTIPSGPAKLSSLVDNFGAGTFNYGKWDGSSYGVVGQSGGRASIPCTTAYPTMGTNTRYDLANSGAFAQFTPPPTGNGSRELFLILANAAGDQLQWALSGTTFAPRYSLAGVWTEGPATTYSATADPWWRIREASGRVVWETSADGTETAATAYVANFNVTQ